MGKTVCVRGFFFTREEWRALDTETRRAIMGSGLATRTAREFAAAPEDSRRAPIPLPPA